MLSRLPAAAAIGAALLAAACLISPAEAKQVTPGKIFGDWKRCIAAEVKGQRGCQARAAPRQRVVKARPGPKARQDREVNIVPRIERTRLPKAIEPKLVKGGNLRAMAERHAKAAGVPVGLALKVVAHESGWKPGVTGKAGEVGLMQIKLATARGIGYRGTRAELYQPDVNLRWGMKYLAGAHRLAGGDVCGTLSRYNAGHGFKGRRTGYCRKVLGR